MNYKPQPVDTSDVKLSEELLELADLLAKNCHDTWAVQRIEQGWTYGAERNDELKTTPCLVPYEELPDSEKEYDLNTSFETIKLLLKLGYTIEKK